MKSIEPGINRTSASPDSMRRRRLLRGTALVLAVLMIGLAQSRAAGASQPSVSVKMMDMPLAFEPSVVTIKKGETVEWTNSGNEVHHATSDPSIAIKNGDVATPPGAQPFDSGFLRPGETFTHTFTVAGIYKYACVVHEMKGMVGEVVVK